MASFFLAKSRKYLNVLNVKIREKTEQVRKTCLNNRNISKSQKGTEPGVREDKRSLQAFQARC